MTSLSDLPPLWDTEARDTADLVLPIRLACRWHRLTWYPVERTDDVFYGLTLETVPRWRHFALDEVMARYGGHPVLLDTDHHPALAPAVPELAEAYLLDLTPFVPTRPKLP
jgi:hypothetical protein